MNIAAFTLFGCSSESPEHAFVRATTEHIIIPSYLGLEKSSIALSEASHTFCNENNEPIQKEQLQIHWHDTMAAWSTIQAIRFGPISQQNLDWKLQFWPDKKNLVAQKTLGLLSQTEPLTSKQLSQASVVAQGFSALEFLLFDPQAMSAGKPERYCELVPLISQQLSSIAQSLTKGWHSYQNDLFTYSDDAEFSSELAVVAILLDAYLSQLEILKNQKIGQPLGSERQNARLNPYFLEAWRSQSSLVYIRNNIEAFHQFFNRGGLRTYLIKTNNSDYAEHIERELTALNSALSETPAPLFTQLDAAQPSLEKMQTHLTTLIEVLSHDVTAALGLTLGFNNNDGD
ncbi:imelysin family protein [Marinibactrum halimedae]|uniref:imelysin family protein n=1 Tax=Marinibactrum halimedae TaxID=1444977 RepID=UPI001E64EDAD|nr:imelysin family protein [Marinibactrum halimedae]MCD9457901.1 imelysin family protein [Marinibactrum halimedae]